MSATQLRDRARLRLHETIKAETTALIQQDHPPEVLNRLRGVIQGLERAESIIDAELKEMQG